MRRHSTTTRAIHLFLAMATMMALFLASSGVALAQARPEFQLGFRLLADQIPEIVGEPQEAEQAQSNGDALQQTSRGLLVWNKADNLTRFTDGQSTWILGPEGLRKRTNEERFPWERAAEPQGKQGSVFQYATLNALMEGNYDGTLTVGELKQQGNLGLGTFDTLDGEMIVLGGKVYRIKSDGTASLVEDTEKTPFAAVTFFEPDVSLSQEGPVAWSRLYSYLDGLLPTKNLPYAFKIEGEFSYVKARSVPSQVKPYPKLVQVTAQQPTFEFHNTRGTLVGFRLPDYMEGVNLPGYHFHFLTGDGKAGGHMLEANLQSAQVEIDYLSDFRMELPRTDTFYRLNLSKDNSADLDKVER